MTRGYGGKGRPLMLLQKEATRSYRQLTRILCYLYISDIFIALQVMTSLDAATRCKLRKCMLCSQLTTDFLVPVRCMLLQEVLHGDTDMLVDTAEVRRMCRHVVCQTCWFDKFKNETRRDRNLTTKLSRPCPSCISTLWCTVTERLQSASST